MLITALIGIILGLLYYAVRNRYTYWVRRGIPHDEPTFPKGNMGDWSSKRQLSVIFKDYYLKYKNSGSPFAGLYFFFTKTIVVTDLELTKRVLIKDFNNFEDRGIFYNEEDDPLSATLFSIEGQKWRHLRHKLSPTFTSGKMKHMLPIVLRVAEEMSKVFNEKLPSAKELEITDLVGRYTADVIGTCAFGLNCNSQRGANADFVDIGKRAVTERRYYGLLDFFIFGFPKLSRRLHLKITTEEVSDFYTRIVRETIDYRLKTKEKRNDFMDMLIEMYQKHQEGNTEDGLSFEELAAQAFIFFVAGFETSSTTMGFALYELAQHQDIQDKLRAQIKEVLAKHNNEFSYDNIKEMELLEQVVMETLRKYPVLANLTRKATSNYSLDDPKYYIEKDSLVVIPALGIHYDPDIYPEPEKFKPERFTESAIQARPSCTWLPFGDGPRNCIGSRFGLMQTCVGLGHLIKDFKFSVSPTTQVPIKFVKKNVLLSAENGIHLKVEKI
ncbi:probable cytochrome P450 6a23 [Drosophila sulfurigaster albostrigata]|uniref:probable cytochrome P450 6a23 n=1 Tax=Drosophila sulfurigaster albostrigata TaxID=89887 RepID=UPI002D21CFF2|nr:probable cytochrome P450 6a23 [Drosophila sulfurigaster albostrigata]